MSVNDQAYIIYTAHYQETSALVKLLTRENGIVSAVVRGVHQPNKKSTSLRAALQLGNLVECQWSGKTSLKTIYHLELAKSAAFDSTEKYICLTYIHELLLYFLREEFHIDQVFQDYNALLERLIASDIELALRIFEFSLLQNIGYGIDFGWDMVSDQAVEPDKDYQVIPGFGVRLAVDGAAYPGRDLMAIQQQDFVTPQVLSVAKKISRSLLAYHMEGKPIKARLLYQQLFGTPG